MAFPLLPLSQPTKKSVSPPPATMNTIDNYSASRYPAQMSLITDDPSFEHLYSAIGGSGLTYNHQQRKRPRESPLSFLREDISTKMLHQNLEVDRLILYHAEKLRAELLVSGRRYWRHTLVALEESVSKRLKEKDEEINRIGKLNSALEERIRGFSAESHVWRELAQSQDEAAVVLRSNLEQVLTAHVRCEVKDAESCCGDDNCDEEQVRQCLQLCKDDVNELR